MSYIGFCVLMESLFRVLPASLFFQPFPALSLQSQPLFLHTPLSYFVPALTLTVYFFVDSVPFPSCFLFVGLLVVLFTSCVAVSGSSSDAGPAVTHPWRGAVPSAPGTLPALILLAEQDYHRLGT